LSAKFDKAFSEFTLGVEAHGSKEYQEASIHFKNAAELFEQLREEELEEELQNVAIGNLYQARSSYHQSIADHLNFKMRDYESASNSYTKAIEYKKTAIKTAKELVKEKQIKDEELPLELEAGLYGLEATRLECLAQIAIQNKNLEKAAEYFKEAREKFVNKEKLYATLENPYEEKLAKVDKIKCEGLYFECNGLEFLKKHKKKEAKELLIKAKEKYQEAVNLNPDWQVLSQALERVSHVLLKI
jgi:tetratricopeptide (TPR) repeat protein